VLFGQYGGLEVTSGGIILTCAQHAPARPTHYSLNQIALSRFPFGETTANTMMSPRGHTAKPIGGVSRAVRLPIDFLLKEALPI
jgi:hypothetical protein